MKALTGTGVALITPFKSDLSVDHQALAAVVEFNITNGVDYPSQFQWNHRRKCNHHCKG